MNLINVNSLHKGGRRSLHYSVKCQTSSRQYLVKTLIHRTKRQPQSLNKLAQVILTLACLSLFVFSTLVTKTNVSAATTGNPWPQIYHKNGALFISNPTDATAANAQGLTFSLFEPHFMTDQLRPVYQQLGMTYVDDDPWQQIQGTCGTLGGTGTCSLTDQQKQTILTNVKNHLAQTASDPLIAGYMILDDYPGGDVRDVMQGIHDLVVEANKTAVFPRFTQCDFGSRLDTRDTVSSPWVTHSSSFDQAISNYSPTACDVVMFYFEGYNSPANYNHPELIDWSMSTILPYAMNSLKAKGWNPATQPLIGSPQLYDWTESWWQTNVGTNTIWMVRPTSAGVSAQIQAFCQAGAVAISGYAWNDPSHSASVKYELSNDTSILNGYQAGVQQCRSSYWQDTSTTNPTQAPTLAPTATKAPTIMPTATQAPTLALTPTQAPTLIFIPTVMRTPTLLPTPAPQISPTKRPNHKKP